MERKLASIQKIVSLAPIENADQIDVCTVLGWHVVVKKGECSVGQLVCLFEIDSVLPIDKQEFSFLAKTKGRIKTIKLRGQVSQGLVVPLDQIKFVDLKNLEEDTDITDLLGVVKYEIPEHEIAANLRGKVKGNFPGFLRKTDEIRIQAVPGVLLRHKGKRFYYSEKLDGSSCTVYLKSDFRLSEDVFGVCSRNLDICRDADFGGDIKNAFWKTVVALDIESKMRSLGRNLAFQGELIGPGVQKNKYGLTELDIRFFNVFDIDGQYFLNFDEFVKTIEGIGLKTVPILGQIDLDHTVDQLVEMSKANSVLANVKREGIIFRPIIEDTDQKIGRLSFKVINPEFLLKYNE